MLNFSDSEPGVPESELPKLFDRFYRVESSRNRHHGGAGLGLAICSNIVKAHNGTIQAQSSSLKGLAIRIEFFFFWPEQPSCFTHPSIYRTPSATVAV